MKVLYANNFFYLRGGSERVFFDEAALLESHGHEVSYFATQSNKNLPTPFSQYFVSELEYKLKNIPRFIYCFESKKKMAHLIQDLKPDLCHLHNIYQDISPSVLPAIKARNIPSVVTLHDYKLICPNYNMTHDGKVCEDCRDGRYYKCMTNRCKQGSYLYSVIPTLEAYVHRALNIWKQNVDCFISPSNFLKNKMVEFGWAESCIEVIQNFLPLEKYAPHYEPGDDFLYLGRLSAEKGLPTLLEAFQSLPSHSRLTVVGGGPLEEHLKQLASGNRRIVFTGYLTGAALARVTQNARVVVLPSECYENAPMSVIEAMAYGKPVIGARIGGIPEMVIDGVTGFTFESGNATDLREKLFHVLNLSNKSLESMGRAARRSAEQYFSAENHYQKLMTLYKKVL